MIVCKLPSSSLLLPASLTGDTDHSVTDETESDNDQSGFLRHGNNP